MKNKFQLHFEGDPILRKKCSPVKSVLKEERELALDMIEFMVKKRGLGLAAPQIGLDIQLLVFDTTIIEKEGTAGIMFNPIILHGEGNVESEEMCLSVPGKKVKVNRFSKIRVKYLSVQNEEIIRQFTGLAAIAFQHEYDHLQGIILSDYEKEE